MRQEHTSWPSDNDRIQMEDQHPSILEGVRYKKGRWTYTQKDQEGCGLHRLTLSDRVGSGQMGRVGVLTGKLDCESPVDTRDPYGQDIP